MSAWRVSYSDRAIGLFANKAGMYNSPKRAQCGVLVIIGDATRQALRGVHARMCRKTPDLIRKAAATATKSTRTNDLILGYSCCQSYAKAKRVEEAKMQFDLETGYSLELLPSALMRPYVGVRFMHLDQSLQTTYGFQAAGT